MAVLSRSTCEGFVMPKFFGEKRDDNPELHRKYLFTIVSFIVRDDETTHGKLGRRPSDTRWAVIAPWKTDGVMAASLG